MANFLPNDGDNGDNDNGAHKNNRRHFLRCVAAGAPVALLPALGEEAAGAGPITREYGPRMKLSLAAYSMRSLLKRSPPASQMTESAYTLDDFIDFCAKLGLDGTELTAYYFPKFVQQAEMDLGNSSDDSEDEGDSAERAVAYLTRMKNHAFRLGLDISGTAIGNNFCVPEGPRLEKEIQLCKNWIDRAFVMGAPVIRIFAGYLPKGDSEEAAVDRCARAIGECLGHAARRGVLLALENHGGITSNPETMLRIIKAVPSSDWFGVNFDSGNFRSKDPYQAMAKIAPYAVNAQIKVSLVRNGHREPGDFARIVEILRAADYRGYLVLEYEEDGDPEKEIPRYIERLRGLIS